MKVESALRATIRHLGRVMKSNGIAAPGTSHQRGSAVALLLGLPIWTEDQDFFGSGIATWTTDRVELFLREL